MTESSAPGLDPVIHVPARLRIMAALVAASAGEMLAFQRLRTLLGLTDGNLGAHLATLEGAGYVTLTKDYDGRRPRTRIHATRFGRVAYATHVAVLRAIIDGHTVDPEPTRSAAADDGCLEAGSA